MHKYTKTDLAEAVRHHQAGNFQKAEAIYRSILEENPGHAETCHLFGVLNCQLGDYDAGINLIKEAISKNASVSGYHSNLGNALYEMGNYDEARQSYENAIQLERENIDALNGLGIILNEYGLFDDAMQCFQKILELEPASVQALNNIGIATYEQGDLETAIQCFQSALRFKPGYAEAHNNLGNIFWDQDRHDAAIDCFQKAIQSNPDFADAYRNLAEKLWNRGETNAAIVAYDKALSIKPLDAWKVRAALLLPPIYHSNEAVEQFRKRLIEKIDKLLEENLDIGNQVGEVGPNFFSAYQGLNDRSIQEKLARLYVSANIPARKTVHRISHDDRLKVGFISTFFKNHTIGKLNRGIIANLSRKRFHLTVFSIGRHRDDISGFIRQRSDTYIELPKKLSVIQESVIQQNIDILFFTDIGMEPVTYTLAFSRLAPIQCVTWGHPLTTGLKTIDYFISSEDLETEESDAHYTEKLVRLKCSPTYFYRPVLPSPMKDRSHFNLPRDKDLYFCPQSLFKLHPEYDKPLAEILRRDNNGRLVLISGKFPQWERLLKKRFVESIPDVCDRILFIPKQTYTDFLNLMAISDVMLDTFFFGGGNTSYEGLATGTPIVTLPTEFLRGRITLACYKKIGIMDCVASTPKEYIEIAVRLGTDIDFRQELNRNILDRQHLLYEDISVVRELENFFIEAAETSCKGAL